MAERRSVEKVLTATMLEEGFVGLTAGEIRALGLPGHSETIWCRFGDDRFAVAWKSADQELTGEGLVDAMQLEASPGWVIRLHPTADGLEIELGPPATSRILARPLFDPVRPKSRSRASTGVRPGGVPATSRKPAVPRRQVRQERMRLRDREEYRWRGRVGVHASTMERFAKHIGDNQWDDALAFGLRIEGERLATVNDFEELLAVDLARIESMPHQEAAAAKVLAVMRGRAVLADEVGLGKTIEAGLIVKELILRGFVSRVLVLCPATLREQWRDELHEKFDEKFDVIWTGTQSFDGDRVIMSTTLATRNIERLVAQPWDLVIVDEAHKRLRGRKTQELYRKLDPRYLLFLTATPVQNSLEELYLLVESLRPGTFTSLADFRRRFMGGDARTPKDPARLRELVSQVMVRTTRVQAGLNEVARFPSDHAVTLGEVERKAYDLVTRTLRTIMTGREDTFRRRHLAHRLTLSPRALAITAARIAVNHPDERVRRALGELADLSIDIGLTTRQRKLLDIVGGWVGDPSKGKVLVFTQHSDTLADLMRVLGEQGIPSVPFHGALSGGAKRKAIADFRDAVPVMVSTDAGAEGLNLQFANCVVNYDLPWNPMRIEQRIGRVHRLTQTRDVHIANLFARKTIDEHVYRLLHDKLRMFELLFGQVTTVLGELEVDGEGASFEEQILDAYLAADDAAMGRRLDALSRRVDTAYKAAQEVIATDSHLSSWLHSAGHRADLPAGGARELVPEARERTRRRQSEVMHFVERFLALLGAEVTMTEEDADGRPVFLSAELPQDAQNAFGGRSHLHLAFSGEGLAVHPEAELCAVGSEVFEEMVVALRDRGDLLLTVPDIAAEGGAWLEHDPDLALVERRIVGPRHWNGYAWWRTRLEGGEPTDSLRSTSIGRPTESGTGRPLHGGEQPPKTLPAAALLVDSIETTAVAELARLVGEEQKVARKRHEGESRRLRDHYGSVIAQRQDEFDRSMSQARRAELRGEIEQLRAVVQRTLATAEPEVSLYAELLAVELHGSPVILVEEDWRHDDGRRFQISTEWDSSTSGRPDYFDSLDQLISRLGLCGEGHPGDAERFVHCPICDLRACGACSEQRRAAQACLVCGVTGCGLCVDRTGICSACARPTRAPEHDTLHQYGWNVGHGSTLLVGRRTVDIRRPDGEMLRHVAARGVDADTLGRAIGALASNGVPLDGGVMMSEAVAEPDPPPHAIDVRWQRSHELTFSASTDSAFAPEALAHLPSFGWPAAVEIAPPALESLSAPLVPDTVEVPTLCVVPRTVASWVEVDGEGIWTVTSRSAPGRVAEVERAPVALVRSAESVARGTAGDRVLRVERLNESFLVTIEGEEGEVRVYLPAEGAPPLPTEHAVTRWADRLGLPTSTVCRARADDWEPLHHVMPDRARLSSRRVESRLVAEPTTLGASEPLPPRFVELVDELSEPPWDVDQRVDGLASRMDHVLPVGGVQLVRPVYEVTEVWEGSGRATVTYSHVGGGNVAPPLVDGRKASADFWVDSLGHLVGPGSTWRCRACERELCPGCGEEGHLAECPGCGVAACGGCRTAPHPEVVPVSCEVCGVTSCPSCGFDIGAVECPVCGGSACPGCCGPTGCRTCEAAPTGVPVAAAVLPPELVAEGLAVTAARDRAKEVLVLVGAVRRELAVVRNGRLASWWSVGYVPEEELRLLLSSDWANGNAGVRTEEPAAPHPLDGFVLAQQTRAVVHVRSTGDGRNVSFPVELPEGGTSLSVALRSLVGRSRCPVLPSDPDVRERVERLVPATVGSPDDVLVVSLQSEIERVELSGDGLVRWTGVRAEPQRSLTAWTAGDANFPVPMSAYRPEPRLILQAVAGDVAVGLTVVGSAAYALISTPTGVTAHQLDDEVDALAAAQLGQLLGVSGSLLVESFADPARLAHVSLLNADLEDRRIRPVLAQAAMAKADSRPADALRAWGAPPAMFPDVIPLPDTALRDALRSQLATARPAAGWVRIDAEVTDRWQARQGVIELRHLAIADDETCRVEAVDTGRLVSEAWIDRSGHVAESVETCAYCRLESCAKCVDAVHPCTTCGVPLCSSCGVGELRLCAACQGLEGPGRIAGLFRSKDKPVLRGRDVVHEVELWVKDDRIESESSLQPGVRWSVDPSPALAAHLNSRAARTIV